jgi:hypothetical protein
MHYTYTHARMHTHTGHAQKYTVYFATLWMHTCPYACTNIVLLIYYSIVYSGMATLYNFPCRYDASDVYWRYEDDEEVYDEPPTEPATAPATEPATEPATDEASTPIYAGAPITLGVSMLLIITFATQNSLTGEGLVNFFNIISLHCMADCILPKTLYKFNEWFGNIKHPLVYHRYCAHCSILVENNEDICSNRFCLKDLTVPNSVDYFIEVPLVSQIQSLFKRHGFYESLQHRFKRKKTNFDAIEDIYDGNIYKALFTRDKLGNPNNISFTWNTDGIPVFKSSKMSLWPVFLMINELPYTQRRKSDNMVLAGLWFGKGKPLMMSFFKPFHTSLHSMETLGVDVESLHTGQTQAFNCKGYLICGTSDLPARACMCNMNQYNGNTSCIKCEQPGQNCKTTSGINSGNVRIFLPQVDNIFGPFRTDRDVKDCGQTAANVTVVKGIKGPSYLSYFNYYSFVRGTGIDYMHGVLLGVVKTLTATLWFNSEHSNELYSMWKHIGVVDKQLEEIKPPNNISRIARSLSDHKQYWKASEWRNWLLYYSLPILRSICLDEYFQHYMLLVQATYIMLQDSISPSDLDTCEKMIVQFVVMFPALYAERYATLNVHQLLHLPQCVRDLGPLWCYSCFPFEDANGQLMKMFHGTQFVDRQIVNAVSAMQRIPELYHMNLLHHPDAHLLYLKLNGHDSARNRDVHLEEDYYAVGATWIRDIGQECVTAVCNCLQFMPVKNVCFNRMRKGTDMFHSKMYTRVSRRNSYTVMYMDADSVQYGLVQFYLQSYPPCRHGIQCAKECNCSPQNLAILTELVECADQFCVPSQTVTVVERSNTQVLKAVFLKSLKRKCVLIDLKNDADLYVCRIPNLVEKD